MAGASHERGIDLEHVRRSLEQTCERVLYVSMGGFDVRLQLDGVRLRVKVFPLCGEGEALADCEASREEACEGCPARCGEGNHVARLEQLENRAQEGGHG
jgi:hypothetical protein